MKREIFQQKVEEKEKKMISFLILFPTFKLNQPDFFFFFSSFSTLGGKKA